MRILNKQEDIQSNEYYMCNIMDVIIMINNSLTFFIQLSIFLAFGSTKINRTLKQDLQTVQARITQLERHSQILTAFNFNKTSQHKYNITHYDELEYFATNVTYQQLQLSKQMRNHCQMQTNANHQYFLFQTPRNFYVAINTHESTYDLTTNATIYQKQLNVFNSECRKIAHMSNTLAKQIYCDRGLCDDGNVIILTDDLDLIICSEMRNFSSCSTYASIKNVIKGQVVGGAIRNKGSGQFQVYIADSQGQIIVFDGQGKIRLSIPIETDSKISYLVDIHPHPLIISSKGWIYSFENNKYTLQLTKCPYLFHKITKVFVSHPYSSMIYLMSQETISKLQIKTQSKTCDLVQKYFPSQSVIQLSQNHTKNVGIAQYLGQLYIGDKIINLRQKETKKFIDCNKHTSFNFQLMKNTYRKGFFTLSCCHNEAQNPNQKCSIIIFKNSTDEQTSSKNNTILMIIILFLIMLVIFYFLKSNSPNLDYDEQLKYNNTFSYKNQVEEFLKNKSSNNKNSVYQPHAPENNNMASKMKANEVKFD